LQDKQNASSINAYVVANPMNGATKLRFIFGMATILGQKPLHKPLRWQRECGCVTIVFGLGDSGFVCKRKYAID